METLADMTRAHRRALATHLSDGLIVLSAAPEAVRNGDVNHRYRQDSDFLWLTGVEEPGYALVLDPRRGEETLFIPKLTQEHAVWMGHIPSLAEAGKAFGIGDVRYHDDLPKALAKRARGQRAFYADRRSVPLVSKAAPRARNLRRELREALDELRLFKDVGELTLMRKAGIATDNGHLAAMRLARPGLFEYQVQAEMEREFHLAGCALLGYNSIVAAGRNGAVLHYHHNADKLRAGDLMLIDAAAEYRGYTADVTRTFPVSGRFTRKQRDVYEVVLAAQERCIDYARAGHTTMDLQHLSETVLAEGLRDLGLLQGSTDELLKTRAVKVFYPHGIGHTLGLDVHDVRGSKKRVLPNRSDSKLRFRARLEAGFVITVEPGIYFIPALLNDPAVRKKQRGRVNFAKAETYFELGGVRIEDDVVIRKEGPPLNLTLAPKSVAAVEAACAG
jgi:Xaa-Pro aminopeptidase